MSLNLNPNCKRNLVELTSSVLEDAETINGKFLVDTSAFRLVMADLQTLPDKGAIREKLNNYVTETPFSDFVRETLARELSETQEWVSDDTPTPLKSVSAYANTATVANRLVEEFESLPWGYELTLVLPDAIGAPMLSSLGPTKFSPSIRLVALDDNFRSAFPLDSGNKSRNERLGGSLLGLMISEGVPQWPTGQAGLQISVSGFVGHYGQTEPVRAALSTIDSVLGFCVAHNYFSVARKYHPATPRQNLYVHKIEDGRQVPLRKLDLDADQSQAILELKLTNAVEKATDLQRHGYFHGLAKRLQAILSEQEANSQIISASKWLLNSYGSNDALLSFVQATVVLEIMLGEQQANDKIGLTELLRNRCAYLVGKDRKERDEIKSTFNEIYSVRSKIVHTGKSKLTNHEYYLLAKLRELGHKVISREVELVLAATG